MLKIVTNDMKGGDATTGIEKISQDYQREKATSTKVESRDPIRR